MSSADYKVLFQNNRLGKAHTLKQFLWKLFSGKSEKKLNRNFEARRDEKYILKNVLRGKRITANDLPFLFRSKKLNKKHSFINKREEVFLPIQ
jgi:hypothetical protein